MGREACQYAAMCRISERQEAVLYTDFLPHLSLLADQMHQRGNVSAVDNKDGYSNVLQHSHAMEADDFHHSHMMHLAYLLR